MTSVNVKYNKDGDIKLIFVNGHSNYDEIGKDIVCSAVSTAMYVSLGIIEKVCPKFHFESNEKDASMKLEIVESNEMTNLVLDNLISSLEGISLDYAKYLKIKYDK